MSTMIPVENNGGKVVLKPAFIRQYKMKLPIIPENSSCIAECPCGNKIKVTPKYHILEGNLIPYTTEQRCPCGRKVYTGTSMVNDRVDIRVYTARFRIPVIGDIGRKEIRGGPDIDMPISNTKTTQ